ncbi:MAG: patatin-like phospholipase family protein [Undibacterium sp.]|nr:patatin-like phospholipase family protein [Undibacterium sp.]
MFKLIFSRIFKKSLLFPAILCLVTLSSITQAKQAQNLEEVETGRKERPKVALVLSGGGARGFAHVGVLRVLKEMRIPVDFVVGTSMGAVIGGAYAAGRSVEDIESIVRNTSWDNVLADRPERDSLDFRRREEDVLIPSRLEFAITKKGASLPPSAAGNSALEQALTRLLPHGMKGEHVNQLPIPFRSVASDLVTGEMVELTDTPLLLTMRASLAVPGMFAPVHINKHLVVDGGLVRNLPIDMAKKMGADIVIAVNVGTPLAGEKELGSAIAVAQQMLQILTEQNVQRSLKELGEKDILLAPNLAGIDFLDFGEHHNAMLAGDIAARQADAKLSRLSVSVEEYQRYEQLRTDDIITVDTTLRITKIAVEGTQHINPKILVQQSGLKLNEWTSEEKVHLVGNKLYGRGDLDHVEVEIQDRNDEREVTIRAHEASWAKNRARIGLELSSDFKDTHEFSLRAMHIASSLNNWGGEFRNTLSIGARRGLGSELFQPLGVASPWYINPSIQIGASASDLFDEGRRKVRYGFQTNQFEFSLGRQFGNWGKLETGFSREQYKFRQILPETTDEEGRAFRTRQFLRFQVDTLDSLTFPTRGNLMSINVDGFASGYSPTAGPLVSSSMLGMHAFQVGDWAGHIYGEWARSQAGTAPVSLGGFLRLSGTPTNSLSNKTVALTRIAIAKRIGKMPATLGGAVRFGMSFEMGGGVKEHEAITAGIIKRSVSGFFSLDTRFGPLYLGVGSTGKGQTSTYLFLGPVW